MTQNYMGELVSYGKSAIRPKRVQRTFVHHPVGEELADGYKHIELGSNDMLAIHFRTIVPDSVSVF